MRVNDPLEHTQPLPHVHARRRRLIIALKLLDAIEASMRNGRVDAGDCYDICGDAMRELVNEKEA